MALDGATQSRNVDSSGPRLERMANLVKNFQFRAAITQPSQVIVEAGWIRRAFQQRQIGASYKFAVLTAEQSVEIFRCPGGRDRIRVARCGGCQRQVKCLAQPRDRTRVGRRLGRVEHLAEDLCLGGSGPQSAKIKRHSPRIGFSPEQLQVGMFDEGTVLPLQEYRQACGRDRVRYAGVLPWPVRRDGRDGGMWIRDIAHRCALVVRRTFRKR